MSAPTTSWYVPSSSSRSSLCCPSSAAVVAASPSWGMTWTPTRSPFERCAMRAARRMSRSPSAEPVRATRTRSRVSHGCLDAVLLAVVGEGLVDAVGEPGEGELAERGQVPGAEVVGERRVDALGGVDVPAREAISQRERGEVDELDLVCTPDDGVGNGLALFDPGDLLDDVVEGLEVLHVHRRDDADAGAEELLDVLPPLLVSRPRDVRVRELVDEGNLGHCAQGSRRGPSRRTPRRDRRLSAAAPPRGRRLAPPFSPGRASRRTRRPRPRRSSCGACPRSASRRSCRRQRPHRDRCGASLVPSLQPDARG